MPERHLCKKKKLCYCHLRGGCKLYRCLVKSCQLLLLERLLHNVPMSYWKIQFCYQKNGGNKSRRLAKNGCLCYLTDGCKRSRLPTKTLTALARKMVAKCFEVLQKLPSSVTRQKAAKSPNVILKISGSDGTGIHRNFDALLLVEKKEKSVNYWW